MNTWCGKCNDKTAQKRHITRAAPVAIREDFLKEGTSEVSPERPRGTEQEKKGDSVQ